MKEQGSVHRNTARDRPPPYGKRGVFHRSAGACPPRTLSHIENQRQGSVQRSAARDRPAPYGEGAFFFIVARGPVPRERSAISKTSGRALCIVTRRGPVPRATVKEAFFHRSAGACPPRVLRHIENQPQPYCFGLSIHGEGQALALRAARRLRWRGTGPRPTGPAEILD